MAGGSTDRFTTEPTGPRRVGQATDRNRWAARQADCWQAHDDFGYSRSTTMQDFESSLADMRLAPYIVKAMALVGVQRRGGSNMFRHQISTFGILLDYKIIDPVLLKAAIIHDLFEDAVGLPGVTEKEIVAIDSDGPAVYALVMEVTIRTADGRKEPKAEYLQRLMREGSARAKQLKLADRISNLTALGFVHDVAFVRKYVEETRRHILPYAEAINANMFRELSDLVASRSQQFCGPP